MKKVSSVLLGIITVLAFQLPAFAIDLCPEGSFNALCFPSDKFGTIIGKGVTFIFIIAIILALLYLIWGGAKWLMSGGDKTALEEARNHIIAAIIGLIIIFLSFFILNLILNFFGLSFATIQLPKIQ